VVVVCFPSPIVPVHARRGPSCAWPNSLLQQPVTLPLLCFSEFLLHLVRRLAIAREDDGRAWVYTGHNDLEKIVKALLGDRRPDAPLDNSTSERLP